MSDHYHGEYAESRHDHRGEYADERHDHDIDYAEKHHRHYDLERDDETAQQELQRVHDDVDELRRQLDDAIRRIRQLEAGTVLLAPDQAATVAGALEDAETYRMREASGYCADCEADPRGACDGCLEDLETAQEYHDLAGQLGGER